MVKLITKATLILILFSVTSVLAQVTYQGPATGSIPSGVTVSLDATLRVSPIGPPTERGARNIIRPENQDQYIDFDIPTPEPGSNYFEDPTIVSGTNAQTILLKDFAGLSMGNSIPPDPHLAVGPTHVIGTVNTSFAVWDKEGNLIRTISADTWYGSTLSNAGAFDPQVIYDHHAKRWFMLWDNQNDGNSTAYFLISVSDDSIPLGTWYNYALPAHWNGSTPTNLWGDYPGIGFDAEAIYINSRQFGFNNGGYNYNRIRILNKSELYAANGGPVSWTDVWNISYPQNSQKPDVIRPVINYSSSSPNYYLLHAPTGSANFLTLYKITNPLTAPVLTGVNLPVTFYSAPPNANQLGGSSTLISANHAGIMHAPIYRDGFLWAVHAIWNTAAPGFSAISYVKINPSTNTVLEDVSFGASGYWHLFPSLTVDKDHNIAITYSRSGNTEYAGAYYTSRLNGDPPGLSGSNLLRPGLGNYVVTFGGERNRWGDYHGIYVDPSDENNLWMLTEYAAGTNTWGTWVGKIRLVPFAGISIHTDKDVVDFGNVEVNNLSDTVSILLANYGTDEFVINSIPANSGMFNFVSEITFPYTLMPYDSLQLDFTFSPSDTGSFSTQYPLNTNSSSFNEISIQGNSYEINAALLVGLYASSGTGNNGNILFVNPETGSGSNIGPSQFSSVKSIAIHPTTKIVYGLIAEAQSAEIVRVNALLGDAYNLHTLPIINATSIAFDTLGVFYVVARDGKIYEVNLVDGSYNLLSTIPIAISSVAINPVNNELWVTRHALLGTNIDRIYKVDIQTGDTTYIGKAGTNSLLQGISFSDDGTLYASIGGTTDLSRLLEIDLTTGVADTIGSTGINNIQGLAYNTGGPTAILDENNTIIPSEFSLSQNYPNPFNPATTIEFSLPKSADVKVVVYNLLGEVVSVVLNKQMNAGVHKTVWNSNDTSGKQVSSGVYFYELRANSGDGNEFQQIRKMVLLK